MSPSPTDIAWAAGLFEGEGCFSYNKGKDYPFASLAMTDEAIVRRFHEVVAVGAVTQSRPGKGHWKPQWAWQCGGIEGFRLVFALLSPWLGDRRIAAAQKALRRYEEAPVFRVPKMTCRHGHPRTPENTAVRGDGNHYCRPCANERANARYHRQRAMRERLVYVHGY